MRYICVGWLALMMTAVPAVHAQVRQQQTGTLTITGQPDQAPLLRINGRSYVDLESLARVTHGTLRFQGNQVILTLPQTAATQASTPSQVPKTTPELSGGFLGAEIEALTAIREWHVSLANAIRNNYPVVDGWLGRFRRDAQRQVDLAAAAASTDSDRNALDLLRNEFSNMRQESDYFMQMHNSVDFIPTDALNNNAQDEKVLTCERALADMAATKQFQDEVSCH